jgi:type II secretory pathway component PulJ
MRKIVLSALAAATAFSAMPAQAQNWRLQPAVQREIQRDINQLERQIQRAAQRRTISQREATGLQRQAFQLQRTYNRYARNGLDRREVADLEQQVNRLHQRLRLERRDWDGRRG